MKSATPLIGLCFLIILPALALAAGQILLPGDAMILDLRSESPDGGGLYLTAPRGAQSALQDGDLLVSINGRPVEQLLTGAAAAAPQLSPAGSIRYGVVRDQTPLEVTERLSERGLLATLASNWSSHLFLVYLLGVALFVFARRPDLPSARLLLWMASLIFGSGLAFFLGLRPVDLVRGWPYAIFVFASIPLFGLAMAAVVHFSLVFPRKRELLDRVRWTVPAIYFGVWVLYILLLANEWQDDLSNSGRLLLALRMSGVFTLSYPALAMAIAIHGYVRHFDARERRQTRWFVWGGTVMLVPWLTLSVLPSLLGGRPAVPQSAVGLIWLILPTAFGIAIVRESLFDIDRIINRTLVYGLLTGSLALLYLGGVTLLTGTFRTLTGQGDQLAIVAATLGIAAAFNPLRGRIQQVIDRRFYRSRYDAARTLEAFSGTVRDEVELEGLTGVLLRVVEETVQPSKSWIWLREPDERR